MSYKTFSYLATSAGFFLSLSAYAAGSLGGGISVDTGYRRDWVWFHGTWSPITSTITRDDQYDNLTGLHTQIDGTLAFESFFFRGSASYFKVFATPDFRTKLNNLAGQRFTIEKRYGFSGLGAFGYLFELREGVWHIGPELGYAFKRLNTDRSSYESVAAPFVGMQAVWKYNEEWSFDFGLDFYLFGLRRSRHTGEMFQPDFDKGLYFGPDLRIACDYSITDNWSLGVIYRMSYLVTPMVDVTSKYKTQETWLSTNAGLTLGYTF